MALAIALIHREPTRNWTMASRVAISRSAFAVRFMQLVGEPAMHYAARWKMHTASLWLKQNDTSMAAIASRLGYESEGPSVVPSNGLPATHPARFVVKRVCNSATSVMNNT